MDDAHYYNMRKEIFYFSMLHIFHLIGSNLRIIIMIIINKRVLQHNIHNLQPTTDNQQRN